MKKDNLLSKIDLGQNFNYNIQKFHEKKIQFLINFAKKSQKTNKNAKIRHDIFNKKLLLRFF